MKKILIALTNTPTYGERNDATGLWLGEGGGVRGRGGAVLLRGGLRES